MEENIKIYITQSWLNYTNFKQYHHAHSHNNSFVSGVFYLKADKNFDFISFKSPPRPSLLELDTYINMFTTTLPYVDSRLRPKRLDNFILSNLFENMTFKHI